jgi:hypothetical protein
MPKKPNLYTVKQQAGKPFYDMVKFSPTMEVEAVYQMVEGKGGAISCTCPAHKPWHKHCDILRRFQAEGRINSGYFFDWTSQEWLPPINTQET